MKKLIFLLSIFPLIALANFAPLNQVGADIPTVYTNQADCEQASATSCIGIPFGYNSAYHVLADEMIDDLSSPIKICEGLDQILDFIGIDPEGCKIIGYNKKLSGQKIVVIDEAKKAAFDAKTAQDKANKAALAKALQAMNAGREIIAKMAIRNVQKGLTAEQVAQFLDSFKDVKGMLETGSLTTAKAAINAITPDGVVTTESDKEFLIAEINAFLGQ